MRRALVEIEIPQGLANSGNGSAKFREQLASLGRSSADIDAFRRLGSNTALLVGAAGNAANWTKGQAQQIKSWEAQTISSLRAVTRAEEQAKRAGANAGPVGRDHTGRNMLLGGAAVAGAHKVGEFGKESIEKYREFDNQYRYLRAVGDLSEQGADPFLKQAIAGGGTSKYNDIEWLKTQRNLLSKGLTPAQVLSITPSTANLGQAMDIGMDESANLLEGGLFGFNKERNEANARELRTELLRLLKSAA